MMNASSQTTTVTPKSTVKALGKVNFRLLPSEDTGGASVRAVMVAPRSIGRFRPRSGKQANDRPRPGRNTSLVRDLVPHSCEGVPMAQGLLLAAGAGRRMGTPKALVHDADGTSWLLR